MSNARHSADNPDWYTPPLLVNAAREVMGSIDLDPCSDAIANDTVNAKHYFTASNDGLNQLWRGNVFINPPGGQVGKFWLKLLAEFNVGHVKQAIWIGFSIEQLQSLQNVGAVTPLDFPICVPKRRIAFVENDARATARIEKMIAAGKECLVLKDAPSHANYITYIGFNLVGFCSRFSEIGQVRA